MMRVEEISREPAAYYVIRMKTIAALTLTLLLSALAPPVLAVGKPNILFIFSDDQSYEAVGAFGHTDIETPHLDRLVKSGATFTHAYNMGAWQGAVCVASRTMLVSGRTLWRARALEGTLDAESQARRLWPQRMAAQGYETYFSGKWHISTDVEKCFDHVVNKRPGMPRARPEAYRRPPAGKPDPWSPSDRGQGGFWEGGTHWSEVLADDGIAFINQAAASEKPFFMVLAFNAPHDPRQAPQEYVDRYPLDRIKLPESFLPEYPFNEAMGSGRELRDEMLAPFPRDERAVKIHRQEYYAITSHMDTQIGRILEALEKSGKADNTWIIFTSDHGLGVGHHGLFGKQNMYDHSLRVPFIVKGPGVKGGGKIDTPIHLQDVMATTLDLAGADKEGIEFQSLLSLLKGGNGGLDAVYAAYTQTQRAVIDDGWKLILYPKAKTARLFNLADDPQEMNDLAGDPAMKDRKKALYAKLRELQVRYGDDLDLDAVFPGLK